jgi:hypothetical protein
MLGQQGLVKKTGELTIMALDPSMAPGSRERRLS